MPWSPRSLGLTDVLTVVGGIVACVLLYATADRLLGEVAPKTLVLRGTS
jgi:hypothetical protein